MITEWYTIYNKSKISLLDVCYLILVLLYLNVHCLLLQLIAVILILTTIFVVIDCLIVFECVWRCYCVLLWLWLRFINILMMYWTYFALIAFGPWLFIHGYILVPSCYTNYLLILILSFCKILLLLLLIGSKYPPLLTVTTFSWCLQLWQSLVPQLQSRLSFVRWWLFWWVSTDFVWWW